MKLELGFRGYGQAEITSAMACLASGNVTMGKRVEAFERQFASYIGTRYAVMVNSGSSANLLAMAALVHAGILKKDWEIDVPALTWSTTLWPVLQLGLRAHLVDCDPYTLNVPWRHGSRVATHILGNASENCEASALEDCCEALGVEYNGRRVGTFGLTSTFSFYYSHHMTTIEGGMVCTSSKELAELMRSIRSHGWTRGTSQEGDVINGIDPRFCFINPGYNLRPMEINAAFGEHQLPKVPYWNEHRRQVYAAMRQRLEPFGLFDFVDETQNSKAAWFCFPVLVKNGRKRELQVHLEAAGIQTRPIIAGNLARHPAFEKHPQVTFGPLPNADRVMEDGIYWGCHPGVDDAQIEYLVEQISSFADKKAAA